MPVKLLKHLANMAVIRDLELVNSIGPVWTGVDLDGYTLLLHDFDWFWDAILADGVVDDDWVIIEHEDAKGFLEDDWVLVEHTDADGKVIMHDPQADPPAH